MHIPLSLFTPSLSMNYAGATSKHNPNADSNSKHNPNANADLSQPELSPWPQLTDLHSGPPRRVTAVGANLSSEQIWVRSQSEFGVNLSSEQIIV